MDKKFPFFMLFFCGMMLLTCASIASVKYNSNYISYNYLNLLNFQKNGQGSNFDDIQNDNSVTLKPKRIRDDKSENDLHVDTNTIVQQLMFGSLENITAKKLKIRTDVTFDSSNFMTLISDDISSYSMDAGLSMIFFNQDMDAFLIKDISKLTKSIESQVTVQHIFDMFNKKNIAQISGLDVVDEAELTALLLFACLVMFILVPKKNEKIKLKNTKILSVFFIVILLSSATLTPFALGQKYWGMAFAEPFNQTNNTLTNDAIQSVGNSTINDIATNSTIAGIDETNSTHSYNETTNYNMPSLASNIIVENLTDSTVSNHLSRDLSDALSIYDNSTILQNHVSDPIHGNITIYSDVGIADDVAASYNGSVPTLQGASSLSADVSMSDSIHVTKIGITIPNATKSWDFASDNGTEGKTEIQNNTLTLQGNGYIHENIGSSNVLKNFTVSAWVKPDYSQGSPVFAIISKTNQFALDLNNNIPPSKAAVFSVFDGVRWNTINSTVSIPENSWTYLAGVYNGTSISLYVNGTLQSSYDLQGVLTVSDDGHLVPVNPDQISSNYDVVIGASVNPIRSSVMNKFSGDIQNVNFYKQILGPEQISKIYQQNTQTTNHDDLPLDESMTMTDSILVSLNSTNNTGINSMQVVPTIQKTKPSYSIGENPEFVFSVFKNSDLKKIRAEVRHVVQQNTWTDKNSTISVKILAPNGTQIPINAQFVKLKEGQFDIKIPSKRFGKPGMYTIQTTLVKNGKTYTTQEQYAWGLVSVNTDKSIYKPGQTANMTIVVLDSHGSPVCDAQVSMNVISPDSGSTTLSSGNGITPGSECGLYGAQYATTSEGNYTVNVSAKENSINTNFSTSFLVRNNFAFDIARTAQSKIDPKSNPNLFGVKINVTSFTNATNVTITESVPAVFDVKTDGTVQTVGDAKIISWNKNLVANKTSVQYSYSVPMVFPQLYALGPAKIVYGNNTFTESRQWFVANDPPADTIQFDGVPTSHGYSATGTQKNMSLTIGNNPNRLLLVQVAINSKTATITPFWKGIQLTPIGTGNQNNSETVEFFYLTNPPTGTDNVVVNTSANTKGVIGIYSLYGVDQTTPVLKSGTNTFGSTATTTPSITLTNSHANSLLIDLAANPNAPVFDTSSCATCTIAWNDNGGSTVIQAGSQWARLTTAGSSTNFSWTLSASEKWIMTGVEVIPAGILVQNDTVNISDNISKSVNKTLSDSVSVSDQISGSRLFTTSDSDQISISEQLSTFRTRSLSLSDSVSISEQSTALHFNNNYYEGLPVTVTTNATPLASYTPSIPSGDNLIIVSAQFDGSSTVSPATISGGNLQLKKNGIILTSNPFDINVEGDTQGTKQASTVLFYKDVGASANPTYDVTSLASQNISGKVTILIIHEAPNSSFGNSTVVTLPTTKSTIFSHTPSMPSGNNLILAVVNLHATTAARTFAASAIDMERNGTVLSSNENIVKLDASSAVINTHSVLLIANDTTAPENPTYDITTDPSGTGVNGQVQIFVIQGLKYSFVDSGNIALTTTNSTLGSANIATNSATDKIAVIAGVETDSSTTALRTINPGGLKLSTSGVTQSSNEFGIELKSAGTQFRDHVLLNSNNNFGQNPTFDVIESQTSTTSVNAEVKMVTIDLNIRSTSFTDGVGITDSVNATGLKGRSLSDSVSVADQASISRLVTTSDSDQVSISEQFSTLRIRNLSLSDSVSMSDQSTALHFNNNYYDGLPVTITTSATSMASYTPEIPAGDNIIIVSAQFDGSTTSSITTVSGGNLQLKKNGSVLTSNPFDINVEGDLSGTKQASTVLLYKDVGASANPTYDVTALASQSINGTVKILVIHEAPNSSFGNSTVVALPSAKSTLFSHTSSVPSGDNLVLAEINLHNTVSGTRTFAAGALTLDRSGNTLSSNENAFTLDGSAAVINSHDVLLIASDTNAPANPTYDITTDPSNTGVNGQAQVFVIHGLKYSFVDGSNTALTTTDTTLATNSITTNGSTDIIASIAAVETKNTGTAVKTISPESMKIVNGSTVLTSNEFGIELKSSGTQFRDHVLLDSNNNFGQNPTFGVTESQSTTSGVNGETKVVLIDLSSKSIGLTDSMNLSAVPSFGKSVSVSDSVGMSETMSTSSGPSVSVSDSVTMSESVATKHDAVLNHSNNVTISDGIEVTKGGSNQVIISDTTKAVTIQSGKTDLLISGNDTALSTVNIPSDVSTATLNYSKIASTTSSSTTIGIVNPLEIKKDLDGNGISDVQVTLPANITITGGSSWKGDITVPTVTSAPTIPAIEGQTIIVSKTIEIGSSKVSLSFTKAVRILFVGESGKKIGYFNPNTSFTEITQVCSDDTQATNDGLASGGNCKINAGNDLVVWTKHFTGFSTFTSTSTSSTASSTLGSGSSGGGSTGAATSGVGASSSSSNEGGEGPYLKIQNISYDVCDKQVVRIQVGTDVNSTNPMVIIRTSLTGVVYASLAQDQPYEKENANADIRQLVYEAPISGQEKSFEVVALESVGHNVFSVGKTIDVTDCKANFDYSHIGLMMTPSIVDASAPKIFDIKFQINNGTKISSSEENHFVDSQQLSIFAIVDSLSSLDSAELRFEKSGGNTTNYQTISMTTTPLHVSNTTYILSGVIPKEMLKSPDVSYWVNVKNSVGKTSESDHYTIGVKPTYAINGKLEFDLKHQNRAEGSTGTPTAYFTNYSVGPLYGTVSLIVDGTIVYTSPVQEFGANQTAVPLQWKTPTLGDTVNHHLYTVAQFYGKSILSDTQQVTTFHATQTVPISASPINIGVIKDKDGNIVATPQILHASYAHTGSENFKVIAPDGTCVIGPVNCLVTNSTSGMKQYHAVSIGDQNYRVRYFEGSTLERFSISSVDPIIGKWHVEIDSNGNPQHDSVTDNVSLKIKYSDAK